MGARLVDRALVGVAAGAALLLSGCDAAPLPEAGLLKPQPVPRCEARGEAAPRVASADPSAGKAVAVDDAIRLRKLDYEAQCYRHAEMIARSRLGRLQASVQDMVKVAKPAPGAAPNPF